MQGAPTTLQLTCEVCSTNLTPSKQKEPGLAKCLAQKKRPTLAPYGRFTQSSGYLRDGRDVDLQLSEELGLTNYLRENGLSESPRKKGVMYAVAS